MSKNKETVLGTQTEDRPHNHRPSEHHNAGTSTVTDQEALSGTLGAPVVVGVEVTPEEVAEYGVTLQVPMTSPREKLDWSPLTTLPRGATVVDGTLCRGGQAAVLSVQDFVFETYLGHEIRPRWVTDYLGLAPDDDSDGSGGVATPVPDPEPVPPTTAPDPAAEAYAARGWLDVFPLPAARKAPPPTGLTGRRAPWTDTERAALVFPSGCNYGMRTPAGLLAIDVDHYDGKTGAVTLADLEAKLGPLPSTWRVTSHGAANPSGQRWYRVPSVAEYESAAGKDIEVIHRNHRYSVLPPSVHPKGGRYAWISPDGKVTEDLPLVTRIPELPAKWADYLTSTRPPVPGSTPAGIVRATAELDRMHRDWLSDTPIDGTVNAKTKAFISYIPGAFDRGTSRYDTMVRLFWEAAKRNAEEFDGARVHQGMVSALEAIAQTYRERVGEDRRPGVVEGEIHRAMVGAFAKVAQ
ncbi:bifunctional DNA primase/polymerase [Gordonia sp. SND2]|uniref:bifunctional DNA primase/polymerase n=1 Tax=Gordonia sp. SND2 TaxID=3388659 RepID=UPI00398ADCE5